MSQVNKLAQNAANNNSPSNPASKSQPQATATKEPKSGTAQTSHAIEESELKPPIFQFIVNLILQIAAFAVAIAFGIYAVKSVREAAVANNYANQALNTATAANKLTLLALCITSNSATMNITNLCDPVLRGADAALSDLVSDLFPGNTSTGPGHSSGGSGTPIVGAIVGVALGVLVVCIGAWASVRHRKRPHHMSGMTMENPSMTKKSSFRALFVDTRIVSRRG